MGRFEWVGGVLVMLGCCGCGLWILGGGGLLKIWGDGGHDPQFQTGENSHHKPADMDRISQFFFFRERS